ncbi:hypothetical protein ACFL27_05225 [candidate division CSSED10-310 bacterium]|uniref:Protein kinase domain-containing protein n=1 Tax=candidate division CSSED10-310 bacterium TaxID=2855610 RepID=A0ABV6YTR9_UNCC1
MAHTLNTLPLPIAQVLRRAINAKSAVDRHHLAFFAGEAMLKLAAAARVGTYLQHCFEAGSKLAQQLESLVLPSTGHWLGFLRDVSAHFSKQPGRGMVPLAELHPVLTKAHPEWQQMDRFLATCVEEGALKKEIASEARRKGVLGFFTALVAYRNQVMGHGAQRQRSYYEQVAPLLLEAVMELFQDHSLLGGLELAVARLGLDVDDTKTHLNWQILKGLGSLIQSRETKECLEAELDEKCIPGQVYLIGAGVRIPLFPFVVFVEDDQGGEHVGFLNRTVRKTRKSDSSPVEEVRRVDYLDYAVGDELTGLDATEALTSLLAKLRGQKIDRDQVVLSMADVSLGSDEQREDVITTGAMIGYYQLEGELGRGGMGIVYLARQLSLNRVVALKVLPPSLVADPLTVARFRREVSALALCDHPNVIKILDSGADGDRYFYAMELVDGVDLSLVYDILSSWGDKGTDIKDGHLSAAVTSSIGFRTRQETGTE